MGSGIEIKCSKCNYSNGFMLGIGMNDSSLENISKNLHYKIRKQVQHLIKNSEIQEYNFDRKLAYCNKCNKLYARPIIEIKYDNNKVFKNNILCSKCKKNLSIIEDINNISKMKCPKCGSVSMSCCEYICWD